MTKQSGDDLSQEKPGSWGGYPVKTRDRWLFSILSAVSFLTLQTLIPVGPQDIFLTIALWVFAVVLPMNALLVLLTYAGKKGLDEKVRLVVEWIAVIGTFIGIDLAAFFHASWVRGLAFTVASVIAALVTFYYVHTPESKAKEKG